MTSVMLGGGGMSHAMNIPNANASPPLHSPPRVPLSPTHSQENDEEEDAFPETPRSNITNPSPRCEAFVMTGEKMLRLNSKVSPSYAQARQEQLPPVTDILDSPDSWKGKRGPFDDLPATEHKISKKVSSGKFARLASHPMTNGVANSHSEHVLGETSAPGSVALGTSPPTDIQNGAIDGQASSVTVNALCRGGEGVGVSSSTVQSATSPTGLGPGFPADHSHSEPASPAKYAFGGPGKKNDCEINAEDHTLTIRVAGADPGEVSIQGNHTRDSSPASSVASTPLKEKLRQLDSREHARAGSLASNERDAEAAARLAKRLFTLDGFKKSDVASHLAKNNDFTAQVAYEYCRLFNFAGLRVDAGVRAFLSRFSLVGETSERERVLQYFSRRYHECNPGLYSSEDEVHALTVALLLLNTDLHADNVGKRMTCHQFVENLSHTGFTYKRPLLKQLYESVKNNPIEFARDSPPSEKVPNGKTRGSSVGTDLHFLEIPDPEAQVEYKKGYLMRKAVIDQDGKKTPFGRRGWKMFYGTLKGLVLYLHKDEQGFRRGAFQTFQNAVRVHHAWATRPANYKKRQHVFRLRTANLGEFLFQTSDPEEVRSWIDAINFVAACFSAPPLPAPVSSAANAFHRPLLPSHPTRLSMEEQAAEHEKQVELLGEQLERLKADAPPLTAKGRVVHEFFFRERYLEEERERYSTYAHLLRSKLSDRVDMEGSGEWSQASSKGSSGGTQQSSGQSDRLSYRAAICSQWTETSSDTIF